MKRALGEHLTLERSSLEDAAGVRVFYRLPGFLRGLWRGVAQLVGAAREGGRGCGDDLLSRLVQDAPDVVLLLDGDGRVRYANPAAGEMFGCEPAELVGDRLPEAMQRYGPRRRSPHRQDAWVENFRLRGRGSSCRYLEALSVELEGYRAYYLRDITERRLREDELIRQALHDPLTGLANRALFLDRLERACARSSRSGEPFAVVFLDLDGMKRINDLMGHEAGDRLLVAVGGRLRSCLRPSDTAARLGGDEFALLLEDIGEGSVEPVVERVLGALREPVEVGGYRMRVTASAGVVVESGGGRGAGALLRAADGAMYRAKSAGRDGYSILGESG
ncbi:sensor domain-containing diguanylate cyclase [Rubrobacter calidifluminis]|uniref:sensor domain-containing diguanylate cyclase n=1 Tax=Rubrobacter calidifluminis TaxID=1392640 RepID=UPI00235EEE03|nr:sensor domain-containing diguanylate cyclase [Rubrobacter calidifluminis]